MIWSVVHEHGRRGENICASARVTEVKRDSPSLTFWNRNHLAPVAFPPFLRARFLRGDLQGTRVDIRRHPQLLANSQDVTGRVPGLPVRSKEAFERPVDRVGSSDHGQKDLPLQRRRLRTKGRWREVVCLVFVEELWLWLLQTWRSQPAFEFELEGLMDAAPAQAKERRK